MKWNTVRAVAVRSLAVFGIGLIALSGLVASAAIPGVSGILTWSGVWTANQFSCAAGHRLASYHYDCGCSNNATWFACVPN